ncbi:MAG: glycosyltransferase family A protein [Cyanobacteria bacterium J06621_11]
MDSTPFVSVIIPVFNDAVRLRLCLDALGKQTYGLENYEIVVIDNGSDKAQAVQTVVSDFSSESFKVTYVYELKPGSYAARNAGLKIAHGTVLAFTDADCIPSTDWIEKGVSHLLKTPNCGLVAGRIKLFFRGDRPSPVELYESVTAFPQQRLLREQHGAATGNVFTFRSVMDRVGLFNDRLKSNGDLEWGGRVHVAGFEQIYAEDVCVAHPARYTFRDLRRRTLRLAGGVFGRFIQPQHSLLRRNMTFARLIADDLTPPVNFALSTLKDDRLEGMRQKLTVSLVLVWVRYVSAIEKVRLKFGGVPYRE